jgi:hypothetical protein
MTPKESPPPASLASHNAPYANLSGHLPDLLSLKLLTDFESVLGKFESGHRPPGAKRPSISTLASASRRAIAKYPGAGFLVVVVVRPQGEVAAGSPEGIVSIGS